MATLAEIRAQNPEYDDMTDEQLARGLHQRFYSDMPFTQFAERVGMSAPRQQPPTQQQAQRVGEEAGWRETMRRSMPFGVGHVAVPLANTLLDPARRQSLTESARGALRTARELPSLDLNRLGRDTMTAVQRGVEGLPALPGQIMANLPQIARAATFGPFADEERAQRGVDLARARGDDATAPAREANVATGGVLTNTAGFGGGALVRTPLQAAATAVALDAPHALSRGEGSLQERLPDALTEMGGAGLFAAGAQGTANAIPRLLSLPSRAASRAQQFEDAGVRPMLAAVQGRGGAPMTMAISENPIGGNVRANLEAGLNDTARAAERMSSRYGTATAPELAGENVRAGVQRWAVGDGTPAPRMSLREAWRSPSRDLGFRTKANALYEHVEGEIIARERNPGRVLASPGAAPRVTTRATMAELDDILTRAGSPEIDRLVGDGAIRQMRQAIASDDAAVRFNGLRALRSWVREQQFDGLLRNVNQASMQRLEGALTDDIITSATNIAGKQAAHALRRVDSFYRGGMQRIQRALRPFTSTQGTGRSAYEHILRIAADKSGANTPALLGLKRTLRPDEWRQFVATFIDRMGKTKPGNPDGPFSVENFFTSYDTLSPRGRQILFGSHGGGNADDLARQLDNLAQVAGYQKGVRGFANFSRSGSSAQNIGTLSAATGAMAGAVFTGNVAPLALLAATGLGTRLTGEMLTNPAFVRWLVSAPRSGGGARRALQELARLAARDPALVPIYEGLVQTQAQQSAPPVSSSSSPQRQLQPAP